MDETPRSSRIERRVEIHSPDSEVEALLLKSIFDAAGIEYFVKNDTFGSLAIGPQIAAARYGLQLVAANIEDDPNNRTRFLVLGTLDPAPTGRDRTSLVMTAENKPGAVHALLTPLAHNSVSMTRIESRPARAMRSALWEYLFFIDVEGHEKDERVAAALAELRRKAPFLKVLGSYPAAGE